MKLSLEKFAQLLIKHRLVDECAWFDPEGFDGGATLERLSRAFHEAMSEPERSPPMASEADGWWWYWEGKEWCPASVTFYPADMLGHANWWVTFLRRDGGCSGFRMRDRNNADWCGRLAVPGAYPNGEHSNTLDDMRRRVERAEDAIINATTKREKDHATIRYETVRDILSAYERGDSKTKPERQT